jgi:hypothetical protein
VLKRMRPPSKIPMSARTKIDFTYQGNSSLQIAMANYVGHIFRQEEIQTRFENVHEKPPCNWEFVPTPSRQWVKSSDERSQEQLDPLNEVFETLAPKLLVTGVLYGESFVFVDPGSRWLFSRVKEICPSTLQKDSSLKWRYEHLPPDTEDHEWGIVRFDFGAPLIAYFSSDFSALTRLENQHRDELKRGLIEVCYEYLKIKGYHPRHIRAFIPPKTVEE